MAEHSRTERSLAERLASAGTTWVGAEGTWRHWRRQDLVVRAFERHFERLRAAGGPQWAVYLSADGEVNEDDGSGTSEFDGDPIIESIWSVATDRPGRRMRVRLQSWHGEELRPDSVLWIGNTFWARSGADVLTNDGNVDYGHGGDEVLALLEPDYVAALYDLTVLGVSTVAGRSCTQVAARERAGVTDADRCPFRGDHFGMIAGGEDFVLDIDGERGILLRAAKLVDGEVAEIMEWTALTLDGPLDDALFVPPESR